MALVDREVEYKPFLSEESIKLSPGIIIGYLAKPTRKGKTCSVEQAVKFMMLCKARGLNPWEGDAFLVGFDTDDGPEFNLITAHQAFLKRAEVHPEYDGMESGVVVRGSDKQLYDLPGDFVDDGLMLVGGWARVHFKNRRVPMYDRLRLSVFNKGYSRWKIDPAGQIVKCAEASVMRKAFPNSVGGMYLREEVDTGIVAEAAPLKAGSLDLRQPKAIPSGNGTPPPSEVVLEHEQQYETNTEPQPEAEKPAAEPNADSQFAKRFERAKQLLADLTLASLTWRAQLQKKYGRNKFEELTVEEQNEELDRLERELPK